MGPPGSGKGTQAAVLSEALGVPHLSTGEMLRAAATVDDDFGRMVSDLLKRGQFVSDDRALELVERRLRQPDVSAGWILDGFPRTAPQVAALDRLLDRRGEQVDAVILIDVSRGTVLRRILSRAEGSGVKARSDDTQAIAQERYGVYERLTAPAVRRLEDAGRITMVDGENSKAAVAADIAAVVLEAPAAAASRRQTRS